MGPFSCIIITSALKNSRLILSLGNVISYGLAQSDPNKQKFVSSWKVEILGEKKICFQN